MGKLPNIVFLLLLLNAFAKGQSHTPYGETDSLIQIANNAKEDTAKVTLLNRIVTQLIISGHYEKALDYALTAKEISQKINFKKGEASSYNQVGMIYRNKGNNTLAIKNYLSALRISEAIKNKRLMAGLHHNIARIYDNQGNYPKALEHLLTSIKIKEETNDKVGIANSLGHIGHIYRYQEDSAAIGYYEKALKLQYEAGNKPGIAIALNDIGKLLFDKGNYEKAQTYFLKSLEINKEANYKSEIAISYNYIGLILKQENKNTEALNYFNNALKINSGLNNKEETAFTLANLGQWYYDNKNYTEALDCFKKSLAIADSSGVLKRIQDAHKGLSSVYTVLNNTQEAFKHYKLFIETRDKISSENNAKKIMWAKMNFDFEKKQQLQKLDQQKKEELYLAQLKQQKTQRYALAVSLILILLGAVFVFQRIHSYQKQKVLTLRNKIASDLHDEVGSALSSISMYAGVARLANEKTQDEFVEKIESTSRETIENMSDIVWSIQPKNDDFNNILEKMKNFGFSVVQAAGIDFSFDYAQGIEKTQLDIEQRKNFFLVYKEAINNAAKYSKATNINIRIEKKGKNLAMRIFDDGIGFNTGNDWNGNGLQNMKQRAKDIKGILNITSEPNKGTSIEFEFKTT